MDDRLFDYIFSKQPKMNPLLAEGIVLYQLERPEVNVDRIWRCAERSFPPGLKYMGFQRVDPQKQFHELARIRAGRSQTQRSSYDVSRSDLYMIQFNFEYQGQPLRPRYILMPFASAAGTIMIRGSTFTISPVLADRCISVNKNALYVPLTRDKLTFKQGGWVISVNGAHRSVFFHYSSIHHHKPDRVVTKHTEYVRSFETLVLYMFAKYGFSESFIAFAETDVVVGTAETINAMTHPADQWTVYSSSGHVPSSLRKNRSWMPTPIVLAVKKEKATAMVDSMIAGFYYVMDHYPDRIFDLEDLENPHTWLRILGLSIFGPAASEGALVEKATAHIKSLDQYIDALAQQNLEADGLICPNIYHLFAYVIENMGDLIAKSESNRMDGKRLMTWKYVLSNITEAIFNLTWKLDNKGKELSVAELESRFNRYLSPELIFQINSGHGEVSTETSPSDSMVIKYTSKIVPQNETTKRGGKSSSGDHGSSFSDPSLRLHSSVAACGSYLFLPKASPIGTARLNIWGEVTPHGDLLIPAQFKPILDDVQAKIKTDISSTQDQNEETE